MSKVICLFRLRFTREEEGEKGSLVKCIDNTLPQKFLRRETLRKMTYIIGRDEPLHSSGYIKGKELTRPLKGTLPPFWDILKKTRGFVFVDDLSTHQPRRRVEVGPQLIERTKWSQAHQSFLVCPSKTLLSNIYYPCPFSSFSLFQVR